MTAINHQLDADGPPAGSAAGTQDCLSKLSVRAVLFVLLLACLMAFSAIFLILANEGDTIAAAGVPRFVPGAVPGLDR